MSYWTLQQLAAEVKDIVDNASWTPVKIKGKINEVLVEVAHHERVHLPALEEEDDLTTSLTLSYIALPTDIQYGRKRSVFKVINTSQSNTDVPVYSSLSVLRSKVPDWDLEGTVIGCAVRGSNLHYQRIPSTAETLRVYYFKTVTTLSADDSTPSVIPNEDLAKRLLVHGSCAKIFARIYQDSPQTSPLVVEHKAEYDKAFKELLSFIGPWDLGFDAFKA